MRNVISIRSVSGLMVIVCLLTSVIAYALCGCAAFCDSKITVITRDDGVPSPTDSQAPFEEKEIEGDGEPEGSEDSLFFMRLTADTMWLASFEACNDHVNEVPRFQAVAAHIPLYLAKRAFLI